jgi:uncharacterized protein
LDGGLSLKIDVSEILKVPGASIPFEVEGDLGKDESAGLFEASGPFSARGVATSIGDGVYVEAHAEGKVNLVCSRCLVPFTKTVALNCEGKFVEDAQSHETDDEVEVFPLDGEFCDLDEMLRHEIVLSHPMKPLCSTGCKGICAVCGKNLNEGDCGCEAPESQETAFGKKLLEAVNERGKKHGRS